MIVWPDGSVTGSVDLLALEEIHKAQKKLSKKQLEAIGPVESLEQLLAATAEPEPESKKPAAKKGDTSGDVAT